MEKELTYIDSEIIRNDAKTLLDLLPDYFYKVAASSTGKYHPKFSLGEGGLLRHVKVATRIAYELLGLEQYTNKFTRTEKDLILLALMLHDGFKHGIPNEDGSYNTYTVAEHPVLMHSFILWNADKLKMTKEEIRIMCNAISKHMGEWNRDYNQNVFTEKPTSELEQFVHTCDYLSSRKWLSVEFLGGEINDK